MSAGYDGRVRGFPAFPRGTRVQRRSHSWWGTAWIAALEDSSLDPEPLAKGRALAYAGHVGALTVSPGRVGAPVQGPDAAAYQTAVYVETLSDSQWDRFFDQTVAQAGHVAALLDGDMPRELVDSAADAGVPLLPALGDLEGECSCDELDQPCRHAAALSYQVARLLDEDPFVLLLLRGRSQREVLEEVQQRGGRQESGPGTGTESEPEPKPEPEPVPGPPVPSVTAPKAQHALPPPPPIPSTEPPRVDVPSALGVDRDGIAWLVADAAARAREWLVSGEPPPAFDPWRDTVRLAATLPHPRVIARLRNASGRPDELPRAARAWKYGGASGLDVLETPRTLTKRELVAASVSIAAAWDDEDAPTFAVSGNRWTLVGRGLQVRYGRDQRWYPYRDVNGEWWPAGLPQGDPAVALGELL